NSIAQVPLDVLGQRVAAGTTEQKRDALFQIRNLHSEEASRLAVPALTDADAAVRATAAASVVFLSGDDSARLLAPLLKDKSEFVRREAAFTLGEVGNRSSTSSLVEVLQRDKSREVRSAAAGALGKIGDPAAIDALNAVLRKNPSDDTEFIRRSAARSIGHIAQIIAGIKPEVIIPQNFLDEKYKNIARG